MKFNKGIIALIVIAAGVVGGLSFFGVADLRMQKKDDESRILHVGEYRSYFKRHPYEGHSMLHSEGIYSSLVTMCAGKSRGVLCSLENEYELFEPETIRTKENYVEGVLRDDIYFHNGDKLTVEDIQFSEKLYYGDRFKIKSSDARGKVEGLGGRRVRLTANGPLAGVEEAMPFAILNKRYEEEHMRSGEPYMPMGTGPYKVVSINEESGEIRLKRFDKYFMKTKSYFDEIVIHLFDNAAAISIAFLEGKLDYTRELSALDLKLIEDKKGFNVDRRDVACPYVAIVQRTGAGADQRVRRALSLLINRDEIIYHSAIAPFAAAAVDTPYRFKTTALQEFVLEEKEDMYRPEEAFRLLEKAGWRRVNNRLLNDKGEPLLIQATIVNYTESSMSAYRVVLSQWVEAGTLLADYQIQEDGDVLMSPPGSRKSNVVSVLFSMKCSLESSAATRSVYCDSVPPEASMCEDETMAPYLDQRMRKSDDKETVLRFAQKLRDNATLILLYYPSEAFSTSWKLTAEEHMELMRNPWTLHYLYRGVREPKDAFKGDS